MYKNVASQQVAVYAHDTTADAPETGDAANITAQWSLDGGATAVTNDANPTELDAVDAPGVYLFDMLQAETNGDLFILSAVSGTADISIEPVMIYTLPGSATALESNVVSQDNIDFGALQKASLNAATPASVVGAVGSVTGAVGSVTGAVGSVTAVVEANVASQDNIDFGALQKASLDAATPASVVGAVGSVTGAVGSVTAMGAGSIDDAAMAADMDIYQAEVWAFIDAANVTDRYVVAWYKNGAPILAGIAAPTIQIYLVSTGANLIAATPLTPDGNGGFRYATLVALMTAGVSYMAKLTATIDAAARTWLQPVGRDSV